MLNDVAYSPDSFLKVPLVGTFKKLSEFYGSALRCNFKQAMNLSQNNKIYHLNLT